LRSGDYPIMGEASNGPDAIALCTKIQPGLALLDINMR
jgi:YesN/AraC family two-component response regulator